MKAGGGGGGENLIVHAPRVPAAAEAVIKLTANIAIPPPTLQGRAAAGACCATAPRGRGHGAAGMASVRPFTGHRGRGQPLGSMQPDKDIDPKDVFRDLIPSIWI